MSPARSRAVGFSRVLRTSDATTLALSICFAVSALACMPIVVGLAGSDSPTLYLLAFALYLPLLLALADRARQADELASLYHLARSTESVPRAFFVGWLKLGGYVAVAGLLTQGILAATDAWLVQLLGWNPHDFWVGALFIATAALDETLSRRPLWRLRRITVTLALSTLGGLVLWALLNEPEGAVPTPAPLLEPHDLAAIAVLGAGLWAMDLILVHRPQLRRPLRTTSVAMILAWALTTLFGGLIAFLLVRHPQLQRANWTGVVSWDENRMELLSALAIALICWVGLARVIASGARLLGAMRRDGFLPTPLAPNPHGVLAERAVALMAIAGLLATQFGPPARLAGVATVTFVWAAAICLDPWIRSKKVAESSTLPFHPLVPLLGVGISVFLTLVLPWIDPLAVVLWSLVGALVYFSFAQRASRETIRESLSIGATEIQNVDEIKVLVAVSEDSRAVNLVDAAAALARAIGGRAIALRVVPIEEHTPIGTSRWAARADWRSLQGVIEASGHEDSVQPVVRLAPSAGLGILEAASEYEVDWILLGGPSAWDRSRSQDLSAAETVFEASSRQLAILSGEPGPAEVVTVGTAGGPHAPLALRLGAALAESLDVELHLVNVQSGPQTEGEPDPLEETIGRAEIGYPVQKRTIKNNNVTEGLLEVAAEQPGALVLGASIDRLFNQSIPEGLVRDVAAQRQGVTITVKRSEARRRFWLRRLWSWLTNPLPQLSVSERAEVFGDMRHSARASVDFYVLISLAAAIATLGLALNSAAVIIGAMLVAPLMSPILALAHGIVHGHLAMIRRSGASILQGTAVAIGVSVGISFLVPTPIPTAEILARTEPNLLDLLVALVSGAAAAYAICRKSVAAALPGVAISAALVPPLCVTGFGLAKSHFPVAGGSLLLFVTNLAAIVLAGGLVFLLLGFRPTRVERGEYVRRAIAAALAVLFLLTIPLGFRTWGISRVTRVESRILRLFRQAVPDEYELRNLEVERRGDLYEVSVAIYSFEGAVTPFEVRSLREALEKSSGVKVHLRVAVVAAELMESQPIPQQADEMQEGGVDIEGADDLSATQPATQKENKR